MNDASPIAADGFSSAKHSGHPDWMADVSSQATKALVSSMSDIALLIDEGGIIHDVMMGKGNIAKDLVKSWQGKPWIDTVTKESRHKVEDLIRSVTAGEQSAAREINHPSHEGLDIPVRYSAIPLGKSGRIMAVGNDLSALSQLQRRLLETQESMEQEYARIKDAESRYRMLFHLAAEPVLIVDAASLKIIEVNPAAQRHLAAGSDRLLNTSILSCLDYDSAQALEVGLKAARRSGRLYDVEVRLAATQQIFSVGASVFRQDRDTFFLVRLTSVTVQEKLGQSGQVAGAVMRVLESLPDGFVVVDTDLNIIEVNQTFLDQTRVNSKATMLGQHLSKWLGRPGVDLELLVARLEDNRSVRNFTTILRDSFGGSEDVEIAAVPALHGDIASFGFVVRPATGARGKTSKDGNAMHRSVEQLTELIGRVSLKDMVRESSDIIERLCIEAALERSRDNRASAAQMLQLSRQSFYAKMRRHGLGDLDGELE